MNICMMCHDNNMDIIKRQLEHINMTIRAFLEDVDIYEYNDDYNWGIHFHCKYGIGNCPKVNMQSIRRLSETAGMYLNAFIDKGDISKYHSILRLLQGYFPSVYKEFEKRILIKKHKGE